MEEQITNILHKMLEKIKAVMEENAKLYESQVQLSKMCNELKNSLDVCEKRIGGLEAENSVLKERIKALEVFR